MAHVCDDWLGCYKSGWKGLICDEAFAHPAKYSRALIERIYDHVIAEGWAEKGSRVVDPFGGVALGGFDAMRHGLHWVGCELEAKFHGLGNQNIALWNERFSRMPNWGTAVLLQGDSRKLASVISEARLAVSSPPYAGDSGKRDRTGDERARRRADEKGFKQGLGCFKTSESYGETEGQLGAMKEGDLQATLSVSSPPYAAGCAHTGGDDLHPEHIKGGQYHGLGISSPPFPQPYTIGGGINIKGYGDGSDKVGDRTYQSKGGDRSDGNLETMDDKGFQAAISSPPWEKGAEGGLRRDKFKDPEAFAAKMAEGRYRNGKTVASKAGRMAQLDRDAERTYGETEGQMGQQSGEDFWSASRLILEQLYQVIIPGGHAVFVVKAFVRNKQIVDFPAQWAQLCEAVGFKLLHDHHALLTEEYGEQHRLDGGSDLKTVARKSFFRRLAESKGSPKIDYENVLCFEKPL